MDSTAKKLVDSATCVILYPEVQIVQNAQHFAILVSINVAVCVKLGKQDVQYDFESHKNFPVNQLVPIIIKILMFKIPFPLMIPLFIL